MWSIRRSKLIAALQVLDLVPVKLGIPSSEFIYIRSENGKVKMSVASYIAGEVEVEGKGEWPLKKGFFVDRYSFFPWVFASREIKNKNLFEFTRHKDSLVINHGTRKLELESQSNVKGYGNPKKLFKHKHTSIPVSTVLKEMLMCGKNCAVSDAIVPHLNTVYVTKGKSGSLGMEAYASSDKVYYLGLGNLEEGKIKSAIPFPLFLIGLLNTDGIKKISWVGKYIVLRFEQGIIWQPISEEALKEFPVSDIQLYAKKSKKVPITFVASSRRFTTLMVRLSYYLQAVRRKDWSVRISGKKNKKYISVYSEIPGSHFNEKLSISEKIPDNFKLDWPLDILSPVFEFLSKKTKKLGLVVRVDNRHGISYVRAGAYWLAVTSRQE